MFNPLIFAIHYNLDKSKKKQNNVLSKSCNLPISNENYKPSDFKKSSNNCKCLIQ